MLNTTYKSKDEIKQEIEKLEKQLSSLKDELNKTEPFMFKYSNKVLCIESTEVSRESIPTNYSVSSPRFNYRQITYNAEADFQLQKELMCIGALAEQIDPNYKSKVLFDAWTPNYFIVFDCKMKEYILASRISLSRSFGVVYMPKDVAEKVCEILNNKQVEL